MNENDPNLRAKWLGDFSWILGELIGAFGVTAIISYAFIHVLNFGDGIVVVVGAVAFAGVVFRINRRLNQRSQK